MPWRPASINSVRTGIRFFSLAAAGFVIAAGVTSRYCRGAGGGLNGVFALALAAAIAILLAGWTARTWWAGAGRWLSLALAGQAAALQLIDAGIRIHYQHYRLPPEALGDPVLRW